MGVSSAKNATSQPIVFPSSGQLSSSRHQKNLPSLPQESPNHKAIVKSIQKPQQTAVIQNFDSHHVTTNQNWMGSTNGLMLNQTAQVPHSLSHRASQPDTKAYVLESNSSSRQRNHQKRQSQGPKLHPQKNTLGYTRPNDFQTTQDSFQSQNRNSYHQTKTITNDSASSVPYS